jgi:hypothetical protein
MPHFPRVRLAVTRPETPGAPQPTDRVVVRTTTWSHTVVTPLTVAECRRRLADAPLAGLTGAPLRQAVTAALAEATA